MDADAVPGSSGRPRSSSPTTSTGVVGFVRGTSATWPPTWQEDYGRPHRPGRRRPRGAAPAGAESSIARITAVMWAVMIASVLLVIIAAATDFSPHLAFTYPAHAFELTSSHFWIGFAAGLTIGIYDYLGYNTTAYMGAEIKDPGLDPAPLHRLLHPRHHGDLPPPPDRHARCHRLELHAPIRRTSPPTSVARPSSKTWGREAAEHGHGPRLPSPRFASVFTGLLGGSRVPTTPPATASSSARTPTNPCSTASRCWAWRPWASSRRSASLSAATPTSAT